MTGFGGIHKSLNTQVKKEVLKKIKDPLESNDTSSHHAFYIMAFTDENIS